MAPSWPSGQTFLTLARVPHLPTVWSNCLAAWLLSGGGDVGPLFWGCLGAALLHVGGAFLNDYFDLDFDRQHRTNRPIPSGRLARGAAGGLGMAWLALGSLVLVLGGGASLTLTLLLVGVIVLHNAIHKATELSPLLVGLCRTLLYLVAASTAAAGISGIAIWSSLVMGSYVAGLGFFARREAIRGPIRRWPVALLALPLGLAWISNAEEHRQVALWLGLLLCLWTLPCLRHALRGNEPNIRMTVSGLRAGIVLVDLLAVGGHSPGVTLLFAALFVVTLAAQRYVPAP